MIAMYIPEMVREEHPGHCTWTPPLGQMRNPRWLSHLAAIPGWIRLAHPAV